MNTALLVAGGVVAVLLGLKLRKGQVVEPAPGTVLPDLGAAAAVDFDRLLAAYTLTPRETGFFGDWNETRIDGERVAFICNGDQMEIVVGDFDPDDEQITEIYLTQVSQRNPMPKSAGRRLDPHVGEAGRTLASRYFLNAGISNGNPTLKIPKIREALLDLSSTVNQFGTFERPGVQIWLDAGRATSASVATDVKSAVTITKALAAETVTV